MTLMLSRFMTDAQTQTLATAFHVALTGSVITFLALVILLN